MTEAEWLAGADPVGMLGALRDRGSCRKHRLFAAACARDELPRAEANVGRFGETVFGYRPDVGRVRDPVSGYEQAIVAAEVAADGGVAAGYAGWVVGAAAFTGRDLAYAALGFDADGLVGSTADQVAGVIGRYHTPPGKFLHDIFGNPFRPVTAEPGWLTPTVVQLARGAYDDRAFDRLPVLADALQDAGCDHPDVLAHCRGPGPHVRGCWVADLLLGKA